MNLVRPSLSLMPRTRFGITALFVSLSMLLFSIVVWPSVAQAAQIIVDGDDCTLPGAIDNANSDSDTTSGACETGSGTDTLVLTDTVYSLSAIESGTDGNTATPSITNTGTVTFATISASDDQLGAVVGLAGQLAPNATRIATLPMCCNQAMSAR